MSEIKFRQFVNGKFHYWGLVSEGVFCGTARYEDGYPYSQQFTGLRDKNGKEIYEGDILAWGEDEIITIELKDGSFGFNDNSEYKGGFGLLDGVNNYSKVIGNIYENPELIK